MKVHYKFFSGILGIIETKFLKKVGVPEVTNFN